MNTLLILLLIFGWPLAYGIARLLHWAGYGDAVLEWYDLLRRQFPSRNGRREGMTVVGAEDLAEDKDYSPGDPVGVRRHADVPPAEPEVVPDPTPGVDPQFGGPKPSMASDLEAGMRELGMNEGEGE